MIKYAKIGSNPQWRTRRKFQFEKFKKNMARDGQDKYDEDHLKKWQSADFSGWESQPSSEQLQWLVISESVAISIF